MNRIMPWDTSSLDPCRTGQGKLLRAVTALSWLSQPSSLCSEQDVSGNQTWEERTGGDYCSFSVDKHTEPNQCENTASYKEIDAILHHSNLSVKP